MPDTRLDFARKLIADDPNLSDGDLAKALKIFDAQQTAAPAPGLKVVGRVQSDDPRELIHEPTTWWGGFSKSLLNQMGVGDPESPLSHAAHPQTGGDVAGLLLPNVAVAGAQAVDRAIPQAGRAGQRLQGVLAAAKNVPVDAAAPGNAALRIQQLASRGGTEPRMVRQFVARVTDPSKPPMNFEEGRDFYSNLSRLSGDEFNRLTGPIKREVGNLRVTLNDALTGAADTVGKGEQYTKGMNEYHQAAQLQDTLSSIGQAAKQKLPFGFGAGLGVGAGGYAAKKLYDLLLGGQ